MAEAPHIQHLIARRVSRRTLLGAAAGLPLLNLAGCATTDAAPSWDGAIAFPSTPATTADTITVPPGYRASTLIAWGDALFDSVSPAFDPDAMTRAEQEQRFGFNNDMLALFPAEYAFPFPRGGDRYLLCANHEYADPSLMFPGKKSLAEFTPADAEALYAAIGVAVVEIERVDGVWRARRDSAPGAGRNRRVTSFTRMRFDGPAAQHRWIEAAKSGYLATDPASPAGEIPCGTTANCAGGLTPWGTYLTAEENFNYAFLMTDPGTAALHGARADKAWADASQSFRNPLNNRVVHPFTPAHFDVSANPYAPALYGWIVEIDPYDASWTPRKHTALGRRKSECATTALTRDGRIAVYSGDDQAEEFVYKFVSSGRFDPANRTANRTLLSEGALYAARLEEDGTGRWLAITLDAARAARQGDIAPFTDEGDVAMRAREAARLLGATPMDRPEDVEAVLDDQWVGLGPVLIACTNNARIDPERPGAPAREGGEPSQANLAGHILRFDEDGGDCGSQTFRWDVFALCGDPGATTRQTRRGREALVSVNLDGQPTMRGARFSNPDNLFIDRAQRVWIATNGVAEVFGDCNDSVLVTAVIGEGPREMTRFLVGPVGCELAGPIMSFDHRALFCSIQHPGETDLAGVDFEDVRWSDPNARPASSFPDGNGAWPRPGVVVVTKDDGGEIGS